MLCLEETSTVEWGGETSVADLRDSNVLEVMRIVLLHDFLKTKPAAGTVDTHFRYLVPTPLTLDADLHCRHVRSNAVLGNARVRPDHTGLDSVYSEAAVCQLRNLV